MQKQHHSKCRGILIHPNRLSGIPHMNSLKPQHWGLNDHATIMEKLSPWNLRRFL